MTHKIILPERLQEFEGKEFYQGMEAYLGHSTMLAPNVMKARLPSTLVFYINDEKKIGATAVPVGQERVSLEELVARDGFFVVYHSPPLTTFSARNEPTPDPNKVYRFVEVEREHPEDYFNSKI